MTFREVCVGSPEYDRTVALRDEILRKPLGLTWTEAEKAQEAESFHLAVFDAGGGLLGSLVLTPVNATTIKMRQVAVNTAQQNRGVGTALVKFAEDFARDADYVQIIAHARETAAPFYKRLGYVVHEPKFMEVGIPHYLISKMI